MEKTKGVSEMKVLVTGGAGFIGSHVCDTLVAIGHEVYIVDNFNNCHERYDSTLVKVVKGDIMFPEKWEGQIDQLDVVIHLAAQVSVALSEKDPMLDLSTNVLGTLKVLQVAKAKGAVEFRFASSAAVYGEQTNLPIDEQSRPSPLSFYAISKITGERIVHHFCESAGIGSIAMRFSNVYGPRQRSDIDGGVIAVFLNAVLSRSNPVVYGDGNQTRDFIYVEDVANALIHRLGHIREHLTLNVSTNTPVSVNQLLSILTNVTKLDFGSASHMESRKGDILHSYLLNNRARQFGFEPKVSLEEGLKRTFAYYLESNQKSRSKMKEP